MINLTKFLVDSVKSIPSVRLRPKKEFWASQANAEPRDLYWNLTGEPPTNKTDFLGYSRMMFGNAVEKEVGMAWMSKLHFQGLHLVGTQIPVGGQDPDWNGYVDFLLAQKEGDKFVTWPVEFKVANGFGADLLLRNLEPKEDHVYQIGLYLRCFHQNGKPKDGQLLYFLNSDKNLGKMVQFSVRYDAETDNVTVYRVDTSEGVSEEMEYTRCLKHVLDKWEMVLACIKKKELPKNEFWYKKPLTPEILADLSDANIKNAIEGNKIIGDWQISYSQYKDLHLKHFNTSAVYTDAELKILVDEYKRRHPKQRSFK